MVEEKKKELMYSFSVATSYNAEDEFVEATISIDEKTLTLLKEFCLKTTKKFVVRCGDGVTFDRYLVKKFLNGCFENEEGYLFFSKPLMDTRKVSFKATSATVIVDITHGLKRTLKRILSEIMLMKKVCEKPITITYNI